MPRLKLLQNVQGAMVNKTISFYCLIILLSYLPTGGAFDYWQALPNSPIVPENNPQSVEKISLGKHLFFDPRLSINGDVSCNSCHNLALGGDDDGAAMKMKGRKIKRSAPSLWNVGYMSTYFWDSRATSLENQAKEHLLDPNIMAMENEQILVNRLNSIPGYQSLFTNAFKKEKIDLTRIAMALASFQRSLIVPDSRADQFIQGNKSALTAKEQRGYHLFQEQGCLSCHFGTNFAGPAPGPGLKMGDGFFELYPTIRGSLYEEKYDMISDLGRFHVTLDPEHKLMWRVPSLRNIADSAPYFHNNAVNDLHEAVRVMNRVQFNYPITESQVDDIVSFLQTLTGIYPKIDLPKLPDTSGTSLLH